MKVIINSKYRVLEHFINSLPNIFNKEGITIYKARNEIKEYNICGFNIVVKSFKQPIFTNRVIYTFFRPSKAKRSYQYALELQKTCVSTPEAVAYIENYSNGLISSSFYISIKSDCPYMFRDIAFKNFQNIKDILKAYSEFIGDMHEKGILHKDLSRGNVLFKIDSGKVLFDLVDINRIYFGKIGVKKGCKNFERTIGSNETLTMIADYYADYRGFNNYECSKLILHYRNKFFTKKHIDFLTGTKEHKK